MKFIPVKTLTDVSRIVGKLRESGRPYALDLETTTTDPWRGQIVGIGLCWNKAGAVYIPIHHAYDQPFAGQEALNHLKPLINNNPFIGYMAAFDVEFLERAGFNLSAQCIDAGLLAYVNADYPGSWLSLKEVAEKECPEVGVMSFSEFMAERGLHPNKNDIGEASIGDVANYCGRDTLAAFLIYSKLYPRLKDHPIYKLENAVFPVVQQMRRNGVLINREFFSEENRALEEERDALHKIIEIQVSEKAGTPITFNINSGKQLAEVLFDILKLPCKYFTPTGKPKTDKDVLATLKWKHPIAKNVIAYKEINKRVTTYYDKYLPLVQEDDRIHASFNQTGVPSGRFSCSDPNLQNIPNRKTWNIHTKTGEHPEIVSNMRCGFIVPEDCWFMNYDYSQIEARVAAGITREPVLLNAFNQGIDYHTKTSSLVFNTPVQSVTKEQRDMGKRLNFALSYGMGVPKLYRTLLKDINITYEQAKLFRKKYLESYPRMFYQAEMIAKGAERTHYIETKFGRKVPIFGFDHPDDKVKQEAARAAYNQVIQGTAGDIVKMGMVKTHKMIQKQFDLKAVKLIMTVHDNLAFEVSKDVDLEDLNKQMLETMYYEIPGFPGFSAEAEKGSNWGNLKKFTPEKKDKKITKRKKNGKTFILELSSTVKKSSLEDLRDFLMENTGDNTIILVSGNREQTLPYTTSVGIEDRERVMLMVGGKFYERIGGADGETVKEEETTKSPD